MRALLLALLLAGAGCDPGPGTQLLPIGAPCTIEYGQCGTDRPFYCARLALDGTLLPNGYCKRSCAIDSDCPAGALCVVRSGAGACEKSCDSDSLCRTGDGYQCLPASTDPAASVSQGYCDLPPSPADGGAPGDGSRRDG